MGIKRFLFLCLLLVPLCARAQENITLRISWWGGQTRHEAMLRAIEAYEQAHPQIQVDSEYGQFTPYYQKLITQLRGHSTADIFAIDYKWANQLLQMRDSFVNMDTLSELLPLTGQQRAFAGVYGGGDTFLIGIPMGINAHCMMYNADFFSDFGLDPASLSSWDALLEAGARIHAQDPERYLLFLTSDSFTYLVRTLVKQRTGNCLLLDDGTLGCTQEELCDVFTYVVQLLDSHTLPPFELCMLYENLSAPSNPLWLEQRVGIFPSWTSAYPGLEALNLPFEMCQMLYPCDEGALNSGAMVTPTLFFAISADSPYQEEAARLLQFLLDQTTHGVLHNEFGAPISLLSDQSGDDSPITDVILKSMEADGLPENGPSLDNEVNTLLKETLHRLGYGQQTPEEAAFRFMQELQKLREMP